MITPPYRVTGDMLRAFADQGVDRVLPILGSQRPEAIDSRLGELEELARAVA